MPRELWRSGLDAGETLNEGGVPQSLHAPVFRASSGLTREWFNAVLRLTQLFRPMNPSTPCVARVTSKVLRFSSQFDRIIDARLTILMWSTVFGFRTFGKVANNHSGASSFKKSTQHLHISLRNIADAHLHFTMREAEVLPTRRRVDFANDLDVLLGEVVRLLRIRV